MLKDGCNLTSKHFKSYKERLQCGQTNLLTLTSRLFPSPKVNSFFADLRTPDNVQHDEVNFMIDSSGMYSIGIGKIALAK